ncbi:hypothetical protein HON03_04310 [archaeon]|nr:hypothetical protein [archaeon]MBT5287441.1 hypothetical protein [archaeon]
MAQIGIPINPASKRFKKKKDLEKILSYADANGIIYEIVEFSKNPSAETYKKPLDKLFSRGMEILLAATGDGGHELIDGALFSLGMQQTIQGNLRMGTINIRAESALFPQRNIYERLFGDSTMLHLLKLINNAYADKPLYLVKTLSRRLIHMKSTEAERFGFAYSSGLIRNFFDYYVAGSSNQLEVARIIARGIFSNLFPSLKSSQEFLDNILEPTHAKVYLDDALLLNQSHRGIFISSQDIRIDFGPFLELAANQIIYLNSNNSLRYLGTESASIVELLKQVPFAFHLRSNPTKDLDIEDLHSGDYSKVRIIPKGTHRYIFDGNLYETSDPFTIKLTEEIPYITLV